MKCRKPEGIKVIKKYIKSPQYRTDTCIYKYKYSMSFIDVFSLLIHTSHKAFDNWYTSTQQKHCKTSDNLYKPQVVKGIYDRTNNTAHSWRSQNTAIDWPDDSRWRRRGRWRPTAAQRWPSTRSGRGRCDGSPRPHPAPLQSSAKR